MPVIFSFVFAHQLGTLFHQLNWILMLEYKLTLPKYNISHIRFLDIEHKLKENGNTHCLLLNNTDETMH
jgi:hypothetical protein